MWFYWYPSLISCYCYDRLLNVTLTALLVTHWLTYRCISSLLSCDSTLSSSLLLRISSSDDLRFSASTLYTSFCFCASSSADLNSHTSSCSLFTCHCSSSLISLAHWQTGTGSVSKCICHCISSILPCRTASSTSLLLRICLAWFDIARHCKQCLARFVQFDIVLQTKLVRFEFGWWCMLKYADACWCKWAGIQIRLFLTSKIYFHFDRKKSFWPKKKKWIADRRRLKSGSLRVREHTLHDFVMLIQTGLIVLH